MAKSLSLQGRLDQAHSRTEEAFQCAQRSPHWYAKSQAEIDAALLSAFQRDFAAAKAYGSQAIESSMQVGLAYRESVARLIFIWASTVGDDASPDTGQIDKSLAVFREVGAMIGYAFYLSLAAEARATIGEFDRCEELIDEALAFSKRSRSFFYESELYRLKGAIKLKRAGPDAADEAEDLYKTAVDIAKAQGARLYLLRSANAVAELLIDKNQRKEALDMLAPAYDCFTEGFDKTDLTEARILLEQLGHRFG